MFEIHPLPIYQAFTISTPVHSDNRGQFEVFWDESLLSQVDVDFQPSNAHHSYNVAASTLRGMHFQKSPHGQTKLVSCVSGRAWDVIVDLRKESATFGQWCGIELSAASGRSVLVPPGCAHGFVTLEPNTTIAYLIEGAYLPEMARSLRWDDETVGIEWPSDSPILSETDATAPSWDSCEF